MRHWKLWVLCWTLTLSLIALGWQGTVLPINALYAASSTPTSTAIPSVRSVISAENVDQIGLLGSLGRGSVQNFVWSGDGKYLTVASVTGIWRYDISNPTISPQHLSDLKYRYWLASSDDGRILAWPDRWGGTVWNSTSEKVQAQVSMGAEPEMTYIDQVAVSSDGSLVVFADSMYFLYVVNTRTDEQYVVPNRGTGWLTLSPDGSLIVMNDPKLGLTFMKTDTPDLKEAEIGLPKLNAQLVKFSRDGKLLFVVYQGGDLRILNLQTGLIDTFSLGQNSLVDEIALAPNGETLMALFESEVVVSLNFKTGLPHVLLSGLSPYTKGLDISPDGKFVLTTTDYDNSQVWDAESGHLRTILENAHKAIFSPDSKTIAAIYRGTVGFWDPESGKLLDSLPGHFEYTNLLFPSSDSQTVTTIDNYEELRDYDTETGIETAHQQLPLTGSYPWLFIADSRMLITVSKNGLIRTLDVNTQQVKQSFMTRTYVNQIAVSLDGKILAAACDGGLFIWSMVTGERLWVASDRYLQVSFSGDGKLLSALTQVGKGQVWDVATHTIRSVLKVYVPQPHEYYADPGIAFFAFAQDGKTLAYSTDRSTIKLHNIDSSVDYQNDIHCSDGDFISISFNPANSLIAMSCLGPFYESYMQFQQFTANGAEFIGDYWSSRRFIYEYASGGHLEFSPDGKLLFLDSLLMFGV